ncbi:hypothetical protein [Shewanella ulleungensis]|uniref:Uncharacterized protein n=1 Tax=Shewanella ulleungensis TaxID=2282699 RepID=A0ABQ2QQ59_9GAMM|nr:hypothetical protein [Shewanella ulleungensis]MCL1151655.1 hypothetical protein [Shewanella ulleungensis]GGP90193.1 hypothetical protein GCM10009410_25300 [Shewanella ulleungensis]
MDLLKRITNLLKKHKINVETELCDLESSNDLFQIFESITPERFLHYDPECIDGIESYKYVFMQHVDVTLGEFKPTNISVSGSMDTTVTLHFEYKDKKKKFSILQDGSSWVTDSFYDKLNNFIQKELQSKYLTLPTGDQTTAVVYLPKKVANTINKHYMGMSSADDIVAFLVKGGLVEHINWNHTAPDAYNGYTSEGETIATAILKAKLPEGTPYPPNPRKDGMFEMFTESTPVNVHLQNKKGETPYRLALTGDSVFLKQSLGKISQDCVSISKLLSSEWFPINPEIFKIIEPMKDSLQRAKFHSHSGFYNVLFSLEDNFIISENAFSIEGRENAEGVFYYEVFIQKAGNGNNTILKNFSETEVEDIQALIKQYCDDTLWHES